MYMYKTLGRVHLTVSVDGKETGRDGPMGHTVSDPAALERAYRGDRARQALEADRAHWESMAYLTGPRRY